MNQLNRVKECISKAMKVIVPAILTTAICLSLPCFSHAENTTLENACVGDYITLGIYEQDNDLSNGKEPLEWLVLEKEEDKLLVISRYALDFKAFNDTKDDVTWDNSGLHIWVNETFPAEAFNEEEIGLIANTNIIPGETPAISMVSDNPDGDKIFMLSMDEANRYFADKEARKCAPTAYAKSLGISTYPQYTNAAGENTCWWWLRAAGSSHYSTAFVTFDGSVYTGGEYVRYDPEAVRPAMWLKLN